MEKLMTVQNLPVTRSLTDPEYLVHIRTDEQKVADLPKFVFFSDERRDGHRMEEVAVKSIRKRK